MKKIALLIGLLLALAPTISADRQDVDMQYETRTFVPKFEWDPSLMQTYGTNSMSLLQSHAAGDAVLQRIDNNLIENCRQ